MLVRSSHLLGSGTSSSPGGNTMLGFTHIHRLGSKSGPVQRKRRLCAITHWLWVPAQATGPRQRTPPPLLTIFTGVGFFFHR